MKLGRIKIIPLQGAIIAKNKPVPNRDGVVGALASFMKYDSQHRVGSELRIRRYNGSVKR